jgi:hypothetical protein
MSRYVIKETDAGTAVWDTHTNVLAVTGPLTWSEATRKAADLNTTENERLRAGPAAPCCDCAARVEHNKRALLRLADGIEEIATSLYADHQTVLLRALQETRAIARGEG